MSQITLNPDPPVNDQQVLICLEDATMPAKITITIAGQTPVTVTLTKYCEYWHVPKGTQGSWVNFHDDSDQAQDESRQIA